MIKKNIFIIIPIALFVLLMFPAQTFAQVLDDPAFGNISVNPNEHWAWNDVIGWIDFLYTGNENVIVESSRLMGYANSSVGFIGLNCNSTPNGDVCASSGGIDWMVANDGNGNLSGWAWNDVIGWISFCGNENGGSGSQGGCPANPTYQVKITSVGDFTGWAWNDVAGWISFNCDHTNDVPSTNPPHNINTCGTVDYKVNTTWIPSLIGLPSAYLTSSIFDTCPSNTNCGVTLNTIMWRGTEPTVAGNYVKFQIATDCKAGKGTPPNCEDGADGWDFKGGSGPYYGPSGPDEPIKINVSNHRNKRYFRYKIFLDPCDLSSSPFCDPPQSPVIKDIIINWSP